MNTRGKRALAVLAAVAMVFVAFAVVDGDATDGAEDIIYVHGEIVADKQYTTMGSKVVVDQDLTVKNGATLLIGTGVEFYIPAGVTLTVDGSRTVADVDSPAALVIDTNASVLVDGDVIVSDEGLIVYDESKVIAGRMIANYDPDDHFIAPSDDFVPLMYVTGSIVIDTGKALLNSTTDDDGTRVMIFADGALLDVRSAGADLACISGDILLEDGAKVSVVGKICTLDGKDGELDIFAFADAQALFIDEYITEGEKIESVCNLKDVWSYNGDTMIYLSEISIKGDCEKYANATAADMSELYIEAFVNEYVAWTVGMDADGDLTQDEMTILESNLKMSGTLRGGDVIKMSSADYQLIPYWSTKSDCALMNDTFFYAGSVALITADFSSIQEPATGMSTTDILLIVLIVVVIIAAVFIVLRLKKRNPE